MSTPDDDNNSASNEEPIEKQGCGQEPKLSPALNAFYEHHNVRGVENLLRPTEHATGGGMSSTRFIRLNPRYDKEETIFLLKAELADGGSNLLAVPWLDEQLGFYAVPGDFQLAKSTLFRSGRIYGMDVSSGAAVVALLTNQYDKNPGHGFDKADVRVLDLCCSPGLKLCMIADMLPNSNLSTVVGVDVSEPRISLCKNIVKKYHVDPATSGHKVETTTLENSTTRTRIRLYCSDGTTFGTCAEPDLVFDSESAAEEFRCSGKRKRMNKSARGRERKRLRQLSSQDCQSDSNDSASPLVAMKLFDRVLVDAECSTDGSVKHLQQRMIKDHRGSFDTEGFLVTHHAASNPTLTDPNKLAKLVELQKRLITSGFRLLKPGGILVYSTCSLSEEQNEGVVNWFLESHPQVSSVIPVEFTAAAKMANGTLVREGSIPGTVRFLPNIAVPLPPPPCADNDAAFFGGGFFIAKIAKQ